MADIAPTIASVGDRDVVTWTTLTSSNTAGKDYEPMRTRTIAATVQATGTFDSATLVLEGSNDGSNYETLRDTFGSDISLTSAGFAEISTGFLYLRPSTSGGSGSQDIDCILVARG